MEGKVFNIQKFSLHDGPGIRTVVFLQGCPLRCRWCANPESQSPAGGEKCRVETAEGVLRVCLQDRAFYEESGGGVTLSGGEPLAQAAFARALLGALGEQGIHRALETTGFTNESNFLSVLPLTELLLFDIKHWEAERHRQGTGQENGPILQNLRAALDAGKDVLPRIPVIPGYNDGPEDARGFARLLGGLGLKRAQLLPFHQFGESKYAGLGLPYAYKDVPPLHPEDLEGFQKIMIEMGVDAFF